MEQNKLKIRAVIFDVYGTLLEVSAPPSDASARWQKLFKKTLGTPPPLSRLEFSQQTSLIIARAHADAKAQGIQWPEILWPTVVLAVLPALAGLPPAKLEGFILRQMEIGRSLKLTAAAAACLRQLHDDHLLLGIASNSQAYTLRELNSALQGAGLNLSMFDPDLRFWSFENGFSKPNPHAFRRLTMRLEARGISPAETLMVGDRPDNDIAPARAQGWRTWRLTSAAKGNGRNSGSFRQLSARMK